MSLLTRCPRCSTLFRVTPTQLEARGGKVRCGRCMNVFDAFQALTADNAAVAVDDTGAERETVALSAAATQSLHEHAATGTARPATRPGSSLASANAKRARFWDQSAAQTAVVVARIRAFLVRSRARQSSLRRLRSDARWSIACALAAFVLLLQLAYGWAGDLAARSTVLRSVLANLCEHAGCSAPLPYDTELLKIEASDVHMLDASRPQLIQLTATVRSYAGYHVAYPALDLVLTNANEHALARRVFVPQEYLGANRDPKSGFPPHAEITIALDLDTETLNAAGFRLDLLAAP